MCYFLLKQACSDQLAYTSSYFIVGTEETAAAGWTPQDRELTSRSWTEIHQQRQAGATGYMWTLVFNSSQLTYP